MVVSYIRMSRVRNWAFKSHLVVFKIGKVALFNVMKRFVTLNEFSSGWKPVRRCAHKSLDFVAKVKLCCGARRGGQRKRESGQEGPIISHNFLFQNGKCDPFSFSDLPNRLLISAPLEKQYGKNNIK
jgi:hypothetical protein